MDKKKPLEFDGEWGKCSVEVANEWILSATSIEERLADREVELTFIIQRVASRDSKADVS